MRLANKRAVVTGAANGIGKATVLRFAEEGARVVLADVESEAGWVVVESVRDAGGEAEFVETDVTDERQVSRLVAHAMQFLGGIDVWMNNAGTSLTEDLLEIEPSQWTADLTLNLTSHYLCTRLALPAMIQSGGASLIYTSSVNGVWALGEFGYSSAKAGLISLAKNVAVTYGSQGIRANVICPGTINTERGGAYWDQKAGAKDKLIKWYPIGRLGEPEDIASLALYLASDESSFMTGSSLVIDGGLTAGTTLFGAV